MFALLSELYIENLAVIQKAAIPIHDKLNIFTGETGAGKSILINGINAILGQRVTKDIVRTGADKAVIVALFQHIPPSVKEKLDAFGIGYSEDELTISREIAADGGSTARINGRTSTVAVLREIGECLVNIHGQHDSQTLLAAEKHLGILDGFGELEDLLADYQNAFKTLQETARQINKLSQNEQQKNQRIEGLTERINEIGALELAEKEDEALEEEFAVAKNSDQILRSLLLTDALLSGSDTDETNVLGLLNAVHGELAGYTEWLPELQVLLNRLESTRIELTDITEELAVIRGRVDLDPQQFESLTRRRDELLHIKRRYGPTLADVINTYNKSLEELESLQSSSDKIEQLQREKHKLLGDVTEKAKILSKAREDAAEKFISQVTRELAFLDMPNVKLDIAHIKGKLTVLGMDTIEFLISANVGEPPKPIAKIASGGELSRIMLALKNVIADKDDIPTLIFDEIDTGVSGRAAQKIGIKLSQIAAIRQVLCVTHLAQIAVMADHHLLIEKKVLDDRTVTDIQPLDMEGRKFEIARIMGGDNATELMLQNAEQLLLNRNRMETAAKSGVDI